MSFSTATTTAQAYTGYWRFGCGNLTGWTNTPSNFYYTGILANGAIYTTALTAVAVEPLSPTRSRLTIAVDGHGIGMVLVPLLVRREAQREMRANSPGSRNALRRLTSSPCHAGLRWSNVPEDSDKSVRQVHRRARENPQVAGTRRGQVQ